MTKKHDLIPDLKISANQVFRWLVLITFLFVAINLFTQSLVFKTDWVQEWWQIHGIRALNLDAEASIPTWFAQTILFVASGLLFLIALIKRQVKDRWRKYWLALGFIMLYVSIDEGSELHEILILPMQDILEVQEGYLYFSWIIPFAILLFLAIFIFARFWWNLPRKTRFLFALAFFLFVGGAIGVEMLGAYHSTVYGRDFGYFLYTTWEEGFEKLGASVFIYSLLDYLSTFKQKEIPKISFVK